MIGKVTYKNEATALVEVVGLDCAKKLYQLLEAIQSSEDAKSLGDLIKTPMVSAVEKSDVINHLLETIFQGEELQRVNNFFRLLVEKSNFDIYELISALGRALDVASNTERAEIHYHGVAEEMRGKVKQFSTSLLSNKISFENLEVKWVEDPTILGGFVLKHEFFEFNYSVLGKISELKKTLIS